MSAPEVLTAVVIFVKVNPSLFVSVPGSTVPVAVTSATNKSPAAGVKFDVGYDVELAVDGVVT